MTLSRGYWLTLAASLLMLIAINIQIAKNEQMLATGLVVRLELAPVDPRSLMQGDYMALNYAMVQSIRDALKDDEPSSLDGFVWVRLDKNQVAQYVAIDRGKVVDGAIKLQFRKRNTSIKFASNAWFFEEGRAAHFEKAKYGEFRVDADGKLLLAAMLDEHFTVL